MGHVRLGILPRTRKWQHVVALIGGGASVEAVAAASADAAGVGIRRASNDPALVRAFWLLTQLPLAARSADYASALRRLGLQLDSSPTLLGLAAATAAAVDSHVSRVGGRSDFGEMARSSAIESLSALVGRDLPGLFGPTPHDVQVSLGSFTAPARFASLARDFFSRLVCRHLDYYLSRELPAHVGPDRRLASVEAHANFDKALELHCRETTRIIEQFAGGWYSKTNFEGSITPEKAARFTHIALRKIDAELRARGGKPRE